MIAKKIRRSTHALLVALLLSALPVTTSASPADPPSPAETAPAAKDALADKLRSATAVHEYRTAIVALDELLAQPGAQFNPAQQAWLAIRYGDLRRGASILLPMIAKKNEFRQHMELTFEPFILGTLAFHMGDRDRARELFRKSIDQFDLNRAQYEYVHPFMVQALDLLGQLHRERGEHRAAAQCIQEMRVLLKMRGYTSAILVLVDLQQTELYLAKGDIIRAAESVKLAERYLDAEHALPKMTRARILVNMGLVATRRGDHRNLTAFDESLRHDGQTT
jgi:tetratricopeptide (TPR) repeat protein